jgi:hypothetical protein
MPALKRRGGPDAYGNGIRIMTFVPSPTADSIRKRPLYRFVI